MDLKLKYSNRKLLLSLAKAILQDTADNTFIHPDSCLDAWWIAHWMTETTFDAYLMVPDIRCADGIALELQKKGIEGDTKGNPWEDVDKREY